MLRILSLALALVSQQALAADVILNEYNAVSPSRWLGNPDLPTCLGPAGESCATSDDVWFGRVAGNGGNWFELAVVGDHVDMRGWRLQWEEVTNTKRGTIVLTPDPFWSDMRAGTVLTFTELSTALGGLDTDRSFEPCSGDWWININTFDVSLVTTTTNVLGDGPGNFSVGNDDWRLRLYDASGSPLGSWTGEGALAYTGTGVSHTEICRLETSPRVSTAPSAAYDDGTRSTFGNPNNWSDATGCRRYQDLDTLRRVLLGNECDTCAQVVLNEYNAVGDGVFLNGGTLAVDSDLGQASDSFFGRRMGNGGDWLELAIVADHVDMRGWSLDWTSVDTGMFGSIHLSSSAAWSDLRAGTILTLGERTTAQGGLDTDLSYTGAPGDTWIHVNTQDTTLVSSTTSNVVGHVSGSFEVDDAGWSLTLKDGAGAVVFGPAGEGSPYYYKDEVSAANVFRLEEDPSSLTTVSSPYDDAASASSFGSPNTWGLCSGGSVTQELSSLPDCRPDPLDLQIGGTCPGALQVDISNATPGGNLAIFASGTPGSTTFPGGPCPGLTLPLQAPQLVALLPADGTGSRSATPTLAGTTYCGASVVVVDAATCEVSNVANVP